MNKTTKRKNTFLEYIENKNEISSIDHDTFLHSLYDKSELIKVIKQFFPNKVNEKRPYFCGKCGNEVKKGAERCSNCKLLQYWKERGYDVYEYIVLKDKNGKEIIDRSRDIDKVACDFPCGCHWGGFKVVQYEDKDRPNSIDDCCCKISGVPKMETQETINHKNEIEKCLAFMRKNKFARQDVVNSFDEDDKFIENYEYVDKFEVLVSEYEYEIDVSDIEIERMLSNDYKEFGFLDLSFRLTVKKFDKGYNEKYNHTHCRHIHTEEQFGFIELKTGNISFGQLTREMEFYKSCIPKSRIKLEWFGETTCKIFALAIADTPIPKNFNQYNIIPFSKSEDNKTNLEKFL